MAVRTHPRSPLPGQHRRPKPARFRPFTRDTAIDGSLAAASVTYSLLLYFALDPLWRATYAEDGAGSSPRAPLLLLAAEVVTALTLLVRRRFPLVPAAASTTALWLGGVVFPFPVVLYTLLVQGRTRWAVATGLAGAAVPARDITWLMSAGTAQPDEAPPPLALWIDGVVFQHLLPLIVLPVLMAVTIRSHRTLILHLRGEAERLTREQALVSRNARLEERARIARDMHDAVTHHVGLMILRAGALETRSGQESETRHHARLIGDVGRRAMKELRELLDVLRSDTEGGSETHADTDADTDGTRSPGAIWLLDAHTMLNETRLAGVPITWKVEGEPEAVVAAVRDAAYRVIQEAVSNAIRHAPGAEIQVAARASADSLDIRVRNGPPPFPATGGERGGGRGLEGMRQRVALLGGTVRADAAPDGGFAVSATLPARPPGSAVSHDQGRTRGRRDAGAAKHTVGTGSR